ncbi:hypothetical protein AGMMS50262_01630 [Bacteroidia bacterium]|nr:hypothetical protein AGMMS50262_01630 [Bacteroidia bacterium]
MRKTVIFVLSAILLIVANMACNDQKTMQEYIREEKKAIERFIDQQGISVVTTYPTGDFKENEYFKTNEGLYFHVVKRGNGTEVKPLIDEITVRFNFYLDIKNYVSGKGDSIRIDFTVYGTPSFQYGQSGSYASDPLCLSSGICLACSGWAIPLEHVTEGAVIDLIIPSALGNSTDNSNFTPVFYKNLKYTKFY